MPSSRVTVTQAGMPSCERAQRAARRRAVHVEPVADPRVQGRDHERLPLVDEAEMADERRVEDRVDRGAVVGGALVHALDAGAGGGSGGRVGHGGTLGAASGSGRDRARRDECPSALDVGRGSGRGRPARSASASDLRRCRLSRGRADRVRRARCAACRSATSSHASASSSASSSRPPARRRGT